MPKTCPRTWGGRRAPVRRSRDVNIRDAARRIAYVEVRRTLKSRRYHPSGATSGAAPLWHACDRRKDYSQVREERTRRRRRRRRRRRTPVSSATCTNSELSGDKRPPNGENFYNKNCVRPRVTKRESAAEAQSYPRSRIIVTVITFRFALTGRGGRELRRARWFCALGASIFGGFGFCSRCLEIVISFVRKLRPQQLERTRKLHFYRNWLGPLIKVL